MGRSAPNISELSCLSDPARAPVAVLRARSGWERWCSIRYRSQRGQALLELAFQIPLLFLILAGALQLARVFYTYHTLEKAVRGGARLLSGSSNVNYCNAGDAAITGARNFIVYGNLQGAGTPIVQSASCDGSCLQQLIQVLPERQDLNSLTVNPCPCGTQGADDCDVSAGGRAPDFVVVNLGAGYPVQFPFAFLSLTTPNLKVSVRMPVTGD
jgi:hypothetical protein